MFDEDLNSRTYAKINNFCLVFITLVILTAALSYTKTAMIPFTLAIFSYAVASPVIEFLKQRCRLPQWSAVGVALILFVLFTGVLVFFLVNSVGQFITGADLYQARIYELAQSLISQVERTGIPIQKAQITEYLQNLPLFDWVREFTGSAFSVVGTASLVVIFVMFFVAGKSSQEIENPILNEIQSSISRYIVVKIFVSLLTAGIVWLLLFVVGADLAFLFAVLTFVLNFIPSIGSIIASLLPLPVLLLQFGFGPTFVAVTFGLAATQFTIGNIVEPKLTGERMDLHPITVLLFLIFWGLVWGIPGMFLAVPITAVMKIIFSKIETTKVFAEILAGRLPKIN